MNNIDDRCEFVYFPLQLYSTCAENFPDERFNINVYKKTFHDERFNINFLYVYKKTFTTSGLPHV